MTDQIWTHMAARRNMPLRRLLAPGPDGAALQAIMEAAAQAPDHGILRPWRFVLIPPQRREELGEVFVEALVRREPDCEEARQARAHDKAFHAPCLLVAILKDDPAAAIASFDKLISLGCAIQNMLLAAQALGWASGLASGGALGSPGMRRLLDLGPHEQALCFIGFGTADPSKPPRERPQAAEFFSSL